ARHWEARFRLGTVLAEQRRIPLYHAKGKRKRAVDLSNIAGWQESDAGRETRANAERERTLRTQRRDEQSVRFHHRIVDLRRISSPALRALRSPATFASNDRRDRLNDLVRLNFRRQRFRDNRQQRDGVLFCAEKN